MALGVFGFRIAGDLFQTRLDVSNGKRAGRFVAAIQKHRADDRLHHVCQTGWPLATAMRRLRFSKAQMPAEIERFGDFLKGGTIGQVRSYFGETRLTGVGTQMVKMFGDRQFEHRIAEEFQSFVMRPASAPDARLVDERRVRQRQFQKRGVAEWITQL